VIVDDLDVVGIAFPPPEADPPLIVDPDTVLTGSIAAKTFETVAGWHAKIVQLLGGVQHPKLSQGHPLDTRSESPGGSPVEQPLGVPITQALDHAT
jgi:hypothetical protein